MMGHTKTKKNVPKIKTCEQVKAEFKFRGESVAGWSRKNGFNPDHVRHVLRGKTKCNWGESHKIAVALSIKNGVIVHE
jgi:gp16 family phage-associated protein